MSGTEKMDGCALSKKPAFMSPRPKKKKRKPSTYYPNGLAAPKLCHHVLSVRLHRLVSQKWAGTIQFVQVSALLDMPQQKNVLFLKKSGSQRKWKMSSQSSRTNVSCVNPTVRLFCFLAPPAACYFGIIKESFPRYHSQPRWPRFYLREAASQRWDLELLNGLSFCPHTVCIWNVNDCRMQEGAPSSNKENQIKSGEERPVEKMQSFSLKYCGWNGVLGGGPVGGNTDIIAHSFFFFFCIFLGGRFLFLYFIFRLTENMAAWFGRMWHVHLPVGHQEVGKSVGWLAAQQVTQQRQTAVGTQMHWVTQRGAEAGGRNGMWQQMWGCKQKKRRTGVSQRQVGWSPDRGKVK